MSERDLTDKEHEAVLAWIKSNKGSWWHVLDNGIIGSGVYKVGSGRFRSGEIKFEPVVIHGKLEEAMPSGVKFSIFCSERVANQLEKDGVIRFSGESQLSAQTS